MEYTHRLIAATEIILACDRTVDNVGGLDQAVLGITAELKPHQLDGVAWLIRRYELGVNVILGDEMGLGKTLQAISLLSYLKKQSLSRGQFLVLCPLSVTDGWISELSKFCPSLRVAQYVGDKAHRQGLRRLMYQHVQNQVSSYDEQHLELPFDVLLTTYDIAMLDQDFLSQIPWHYTVVDEAQRLKNSSSVLYTALEQQYIMPRRLLITGTPIQNDLSELWSLLHFCMPSVFGTLEQFLSAFKEGRRSPTGVVAESADGVKRHYKTLRHILKAFMLRRTKALLMEGGNLLLPPLTEITMIVPLVPLQKKVYMSILRKELPTLLAFSSGTSSHQSLQNIVMQLRKACSHPYLFNGIEPEPYQEGEHLIQASGKLIVLDQLLKKLHASGHRVLLFAQMTRTLDILQDFLELRNYSYERLDGSVRAEERFAAIRNFSSQSVGESRNVEKQQNSSAFVFMISTRAGGVGLNLVAADTVIFYEQDWNPQIDKQALQRAHRIGQMNYVLSINLVTQHSIEEVIMRRAQRKLQLSGNIVGEEDGGYGGGKDQEMEAGEMKALIFGLHTFDVADSDIEDLGKEEMEKLSSMTNKVLDVRHHESAGKDERKLEISSAHTHNSGNLQLRTSDAVVFEPELDEVSYQSWVEKFKEASRSCESSISNIKKRRSFTEEKNLSSDSESLRKKGEEKKLEKWRDLGYQSLTILDPQPLADSDNMADAGFVQFVYGDCTNPGRLCPSQPAIIFSCVDNSGKWGHGGIFDALANLSSSIPKTYHRASEFDDLHLGDLHLIKVDGPRGDKDTEAGAPLWVALAVVQSYNGRRKVPRSGMSLTDLEQCLAKASFSASQNSASIHMPRIGYQDGSGRSEWYAVERLLRKYASTYGINIYVYYFRRASQD